MKNLFKYVVASDEKYEKVFVEIYCDDKFIALINQENGPHDLEIEFPSSEFEEKFLLRKIKYKDFVKAIKEASKILLG